jgi:hypothetical protein
MRRSFQLSLGLLTVLISTPLSAQLNLAFTADGPDYLSANAPFSIKRTTRTEVRLQTGSTLQHEVREVLTRDEQGRLFDSITTVPANALDTPIETYFLADPLLNTLIEWRRGQSAGTGAALPPNRRLDLRVMASKPPFGPKLPPKVTLTTEALGTETIAGLATTGTRTTTTVPSELIGNTEPLRLVHEVWISDDLHIPLRELDINPLAGTRTMNTEAVKRTPGQAILFHPPVGLQVHTLQAPTAPDRDKIAYTKAIDDMKAPETREAAADIVVKYAQSHPEVAIRAAHMLAIRDTHLADAKSLADSSVQRLETSTVSLTLDGDTRSAQAEMSNLAEYWASLGSVLSAMGDVSAADRYFRSAWALGGEGIYLDRLALQQIKAGDKIAALHTVDVALSGKMDARETEQITHRAKYLGQDPPQPTPEPTVIAITSSSKLEGTAEFNLLFTGKSAPQVAWLNGSEALKPAASVIAATTLPLQTPDVGPERILRRARLECAQPSGCHLTLLYAWQAQEEDNKDLRTTPTLTAPSAPSLLPQP